MTKSELTYQLRFHRDALDEWQKLDGSIQKPLKRKLQKRLQQPIVESQRLHGKLSDCFKVKDNKTGYRLIYFVDYQALEVLVLAIGKRERLIVYEVTLERVSNSKH